MNVWVKLAVGIMTIAGTGFFTLKLFRFQDRGLLEQLGMAFPLGSSILFWALSWTNIMGIPLTATRVFIALAVALTLSVGLYLWSRNFPEPGRRNKGQAEKIKGYQIALGFFIGIFLILFFVDALTVPLNTYDARSQWTIKSKILYHEGTPFTEAFTDPDRLNPQADYPLLVPYLEAVLFFIFGHADDQLMKVIFPVLFFSLVIYFYKRAREWLGRTGALLFSAILTACPCYSLYTAGGVASGIMDMPLSLFFIVSFFELFSGIREQKLGRIVIASLFCAMMVAVKNEGWVLFVSLLLTTGLYSLRLGKREFAFFCKALPVLLAVPFALNIPTLYLKSVAAKTFTVQHLIFHPGQIFGNLDRVPHIFSYFILEMFIRLYRWNILGFVFLFSFIFSGKRIFRDAGAMLYLSVLLYYGVVFFTLVTTPIPLDEILASAVTRLLMHTLPVMLLGAAYLINDGERPFFQHRGMNHEQ